MAGSTSAGNMRMPAAGEHLVTPGLSGSRGVRALQAVELRSDEPQR